MAFDIKIFASNSLTGETKPYPDIERGLGIEANGIPSLKYFNGIFNRIDENLLEIYRNSIFPFNSSLTYDINSLVFVDNVIYTSLKNNNKDNVTNSNSWRRLFDFATTSKYGITKLTNDYLSTVENLAVTPKAVKDSTKYIIENQFGIECSENIGSIHWDVVLNPKYLHLNGQVISRQTYRNLWKYVESLPNEMRISDSDWIKENEKYGFCGKFSTGDDSKTFRLPLLKYVKGVYDAKLLGSVQEPMLPKVNSIGRHYHGWGRHENNNWGHFIGYSEGFNGQNFKAQSINQRSAYWNGNGGGGWSNDYVNTPNLVSTVEIDDNDDNESELYGKTTNTIEIQSVVGYWQIKAVNSFKEASDESTKLLIEEINNINKVSKDVLDSAFEMEKKVSTSYIVDSYVSPEGNSWYRIYSDGYIEQSGYALASGWANGATVNLLIPFKTKTYNVIMSKLNDGGSATVNAYRRDLTNFGAGCEGQGGSSFSSSSYMNFYAFGY